MTRRDIARTTVGIAIPVVWALAMGLARSGDAWSIVAGGAAILAVAAVAANRDRLPAMLRPGLVQVAAGAATGALMIGATYAGYALLAGRLPGIEAATAGIYERFIGERPGAVAVLLVAPVAIAEEVLWRGVFQDLVAARLESRVGVVLCSAGAYALATAAFGSPLLTGVAMGVAVCWSALRIRTGSVAPTIVAHLMWDAAIVLVPLSAR